MADKQPFWKTKSLQEMSLSEWESLCDGCGQCCLLKYQDDDSGEVVHTNIACRLFDEHSCRCSDYPNRHERVPDCAKLSPQNVPDWMPDTCAYKRLKKGQDLPDWHPLISGCAESVHKAGISVRGKVISETVISIEELEDRVQETFLEQAARKRSETADGE